MFFLKLEYGKFIISAVSAFHAGTVLMMVEFKNGLLLARGRWSLCEMICPSDEIDEHALVVRLE